MSGGSMDYAYQRINDVQDELLTSITQGHNHRDLRTRLAQHLSHCAAVLRAIEWSDSCDTGADDWVPGAKHLLQNAPDEVVTRLTGKAAEITAGTDAEADALLLEKHVSDLTSNMNEIAASVQEHRKDA